LGFVAGVNEALGLTLLDGLQGLLFTSLSVFAIENSPASAEQTETVFHLLTHGCEPTAARENILASSGRALTGLWPGDQFTEAFTEGAFYPLGLSHWL
jgi:hypothetical protein